MTDSVSDLISLSLQHPVRVFVDPVNQVVDRLVQVISSFKSSCKGIYSSKRYFESRSNASIFAYS